MFKRYLISLLFLCFLFRPAFSQVKETSAKLQGVSRPSFSTQFDFAAEDVSNAIVSRLKQDGMHVSSRRGLITASGVCRPIGPDSVGMYLQVESQKTKGRDLSRVYLFISRGNERFVGNGADNKLAGKAENYLEGLRHDINLYGLQQQIGRQQKSVDDKASAYKKLLKNARKQESKRYALRRDLSSETDAGKQDKIRKKIEKLDKDISKRQTAIRKSERELQQQKDQLAIWQEQLQTEKSR